MTSCGLCKPTLCACSVLQSRQVSLCRSLFILWQPSILEEGAVCAWGKAGGPWVKSLWSSN